MLTINGENKSCKEVEELLGISKSTLTREVNKRRENNLLFKERIKSFLFLFDSSTGTLQVL